MKDDNKTKSNFGATGWWYIILTGLMFFLCTGITTDGLNVSIAKFIEVHGWDQATLLNYCSIGGYIAIPFMPVLAKLLSKKGTRFCGTLFLLIGAAATAFWGMSGTLVEYLLAYIVVIISLNFYGHLCSSNLANSWFPKKKGLFLGWSTMGLQLSTVAFVALLSLLFAKFGLSGAYDVLAAFQVVLAILFYTTVRDTPDELGKFPDNIPITEEETKKYHESLVMEQPKMHLGDILKSREVWCVGLGFGIIYMDSVGLLSQWVPRMVSLGYDLSWGILTLSVAAAIGFFGSYGYGVLDMKIGPKKASVIIAINYLLALIFTVLPFNPAFLYISVVLIGVGIGGVANLIASLLGTIFGPREFAGVFGVVNAITRILSATAFAVLAFGLRNLGGYTGAYLIFLGLSVVGVLLLSLVREKLPETTKD